MLVIGVGNEMGSDDAAGIEIARRLRGHPEIDVREAHGHAAALIEHWCDRDAVVLLDSMRSGAAPGTIRRMDASCEPLPAMLRSSTSTHAPGVGEAIELARALRRLPPRVIVFAVEGRRFSLGVGLSPEVERAVAATARAVLHEARALTPTTLSGTCSRAGRELPRRSWLAWRPQP